MKKIQKIEVIIIFLFILSFFTLGYFSLENLSLFSDAPVTLEEIVSAIVCLATVIVFAVVYIIKICLVKNNKLRLLWAVFPILAIVCSVLYVNGVFSFYDEFVVWNIISVILAIGMIALYNIYVLFYCGEGRKPLITLAIYNIAVVWSAIAGAGLQYIHHYYLGFLLLAMIGAYIEVSVKEKVKSKN